MRPRSPHLDLPQVVVRTRDIGGVPLTRTRALDPKWREAAAGQPKVLSMLASTADAVDWGYMREVLVHAPGSVDWQAARALLINHDPNLMAGTLSNLRLSADGMECDAQLLPGAMMASGVSVADAIAAGALRGVSIGYVYNRDDTTFDEATRTLTVRKWRLLEVTLTPIPADDEAALRTRSAFAADLASTHRAAPAPTNKDPSMNFEQWLAARGFDAAKLSEADKTKARAIHAAGGELPSDFAPSARTADESGRAREMQAMRERAEKAEREVKLRKLATQHGVDTKDLDFGTFPTESAGLEALLERKAKAEATPAPANGIVTVTRDQGDKFLARARGATLMLAGVKPDEKEKREIDAAGGMQAVPVKALLRSIARMDGNTDADSWSEIELAMWAVRHINLSKFAQRDASGANKLVAGYSSILANVAEKALIGGMNGYNAASWDVWSTIRESNNFLAVTNAGIASGRLTETPEDEAFPELLQKDGGYNSQLGLWGATVSLTYQTLVNDMLGAFMGELRRAGAIAAQTIDREVYNKLLNATWTNDNSGTSALSTIANLDKPRAALRAKKAPTGDKMGVVARYLLHDPANALAAQQATGAIYAGGATTAPSMGARQIVPVESHWIGDTALLAGALTTDYYLAGDQSVIDTVLVNFLAGVGRNPIILPFDAGSVAAEKYKIMLPFRATVATHSDGTNTRVTGIQRALVA